MRLFKSKKNKKIAIALGLSLVLGIASSGILYAHNQKNHLGISYVNHNQASPEIFNRGAADTSNAAISNTDRNLKELTTPIETEDTRPIVQPIEITKPEETPKDEPQPTPMPTPSPKPEPKKETESVVLELNGVRVNAIVEKPAGQTLNDADIAAGITNRNPFVYDLVGRVVSVEVTKELEAAVSKDLLDHKTLGLKAFQTSFFSSFSFEKREGEYDPELFFKQNYDYWQRVLQRFRKLLDGPRVLEFLLPEKKEEYSNKHFDSDDIRYAWLIQNLDYSKFNTLSAGAKKFLGEGYTATADNVYINENGELDSYGYDVPAGYNKVTTLYEKLNKERRVFSISGYYGRNPDQINKGEYPGWTKRDATGEFNSYGIGNGDDIKVFELSKTEDGKERKELAVEIDAANSEGYKKTLEFINKLKSDGKKITSYRIRNMGKNDPNQAFKEIMKALPDDLPHLELFFAASATNTASLIELENKKIKELSLFTLGNIHLDSWSINPLALKGVEWINTIDYSNNYGIQNAASRIVFNTLAFEESDIQNNSSDKYKRINDGLRMAYYVRNNEGIFQGNFGPGNNPDNDEGNSSYPTRLDFSGAPSIKSLKGLVFYDKFNSNNRPRKLKNLKFFNDKSYFEVSGDDLDGGQLDSVMAIGEPAPPKTKIEFSNGTITQKIRIKGKAQLTESALSNLGVLISLAEIPRNIEVEGDASELKSQLSARGYNVSEYSGSSSSSEDDSFN
ncbi:putative immunoglobulin-blocking virulence protein [Metamycoplasma auris]|uniref:Putative immunoglobulin-blocking virulence protein n=1 Tax=Metamycoplasma auris TaxID=51363 RepID=A0A2W7GV66_9BACT|nr:putative immunoglobulin-blocking virulence protein [Metamycoplasma auris]PZW01583.1 putative immunoglobulin-blocking virulence protein [Metamycoplasma auris]